MNLVGDVLFVVAVCLILGVAEREVPHDLGDLVDVARLQLLLVVLEAP